MSNRNLSSGLWSFLGVSFLFDSGMFIFFLLYNLYLLDLGFREDFLGWIASAVALGNIVGSLPGGIFAYRVGLRKALLVCLCIVPVIAASRAIATSSFWLLGFGFIGGVALSLWGVLEPPVISQVTNDENRASGFSVVFAAGIGFGVIGGLVGGYLPGLLSFLWVGRGAGAGKRAALLFACGISALALWPASRLRFQAAPAPMRKHYPRNAFVFRFFPALAIWSFATGVFGPFFNAYFSRRMHMSVEHIGQVFAVAQLTQVLAILVAPLIFRYFGLIAGITYSQFACGLSLCWLAFCGDGLVSTAAYATYTAFHWMSEPGMYTLLMTKVQHGERAGASALNLLVISGSRALAAAVGGAAFTKFGYPIVMTATAIAILLAGWVFRALLTEDSSQAPSRTQESQGA
ncbi:MAG: MFS transporter [Candidatus Acidiferrales bacterium]